MQAGTSHFLGQNFARAQEIKFQDQNGQEVFAWTTSWGVSTRLVGALIMTHSDDDGLVLPPRLAPNHVVILPIYRKDDERAQVLEYCNKLETRTDGRLLRRDGPTAGRIDDRDMRGGEKNWHHIKRGVPLRLEIGPKDIAKDAVFLGRRDTGEKQGIGRDELVGSVVSPLDEMQDNLFQTGWLCVRTTRERSMTWKNSKPSSLRKVPKSRRSTGASPTVTLSKIPKWRRSSAT